MAASQREEMLNLEPGPSSLSPLPGLFDCHGRWDLSSLCPRPLYPNSGARAAGQSVS